MLERVTKQCLHCIATTRRISIGNRGKPDSMIVRHALADTIHKLQSGFLQMLHRPGIRISK